jgi:hypothetical protein
MINIKWVGAFAMALLLSACGGGGGDSGTSPFVPPSSTPSSSVADLSLVLNKTSITNAGSDTVTATVTAVDANRVAIADVPVTIGADANAVVVATSAVTDENGRITATISNGTDKANRTVTVTATSGGLTRTSTFVVGGSTLSATGSEVVAPNTAAFIRYRLVDQTTTPMSGQTITITAPGLTDVTGTTDSNGEFVYNYTAPSATGPLSVTATAAGVTQVKVVNVQSTAIDPAPFGVTSASISADPSVVSVGGERAELRALFVGANNAPIPRIRVRFDLGGDPNSIGGTITTGTDYVYSDTTGVAVSAYQPGGRASPTDGVTVRACWDYNDFPVGTCPNAVTKTLTVVSDALSVTIGFNNLIQDGTQNLTYIKKFVVTVNDAAGQAKADVLVTPSVDLLHYYKGYYTTPSAWTKAVNVKCTNEDANRNGILEVEEDAIINDGNANGVLDPRKADVLVSVVGSNRTAANGTVVIQIEYPKNVATWLDYRLLVTAGAVTGTEGRASVSQGLSAAASEFDAENPPSFVVSPYGTAGVCTDPN